MFNSKRNSVGIIIPDLNLYNRAIVIKIAWYWYRNRLFSQLNRIEGPEMHPYTFGHLIFDKEVKTIQWKNTSHSPNCVEVLSGSLHVEECKLTHSYHLNKAQVEVDPHKTSYSESNQRKSGE